MLQSIIDWLCKIEGEGDIMLTMGQRLKPLVAIRSGSSGVRVNDDLQSTYVALSRQ